MIYKYKFSVSGSNLYPREIINKLEGSLIVDRYFSPDDEKHTKSEEYEYGGMSFLHPKEFSTQNQIFEYERAFIEFMNKNYPLFVENGGNNLDISIEIYFSGTRGNFVIFKELIKNLASFNISLSINWHVAKHEWLQEWKNEIEASW